MNSNPHDNDQGQVEPEQLRERRRTANQWPVDMLIAHLKQCMRALRSIRVDDDDIAARIKLVLIGADEAITQTLKNSKEIQMTPHLEHGEPLVITGPQGSGKTTLAREIAKKHGEFAEIEARDLERLFHPWMNGEIKTLIVDGLPSTHHVKEFIRELLENEEVVAHRKGQQDHKVPAPNFIFVTGDVTPLKNCIGRRYRVIDLEPAPQ